MYHLPPLFNFTRFFLTPSFLCALTLGENGLTDSLKSLTCHGRTARHVWDNDERLGGTQSGKNSSLS